MPTELVTVNLTRENEKEAWGFELSGGGRDKNVRLFIEQVRHLHTILKILHNCMLYALNLPCEYKIITNCQVREDNLSGKVT